MLNHGVGTCRANFVDYYRNLLRIVIEVHLARTQGHGRLLRLRRRCRQRLPALGALARTLVRAHRTSIAGHFPIVVWVETLDPGSQLLGVGAEVGLVDDSLLVDHEGFTPVSPYFTGQATSAKPAIMLPLMT